MKAALTRKMFWGLIGILAMGLFSLNAYALHYGQTYDVLEFVDEANKAGAIGCALSIGVPMVATGIPGVGEAIQAGQAVGGSIGAAAVQGAIIGGTTAAITGGDVGDAALYGAASSAVLAGITGQGPVAQKGFKDYMKSDYLKAAGTNAVTSQVGKAAADIAVNDWGMSPESAQFLGMAASAGLSIAASAAQAKSKVATAEEAQSLNRIGITDYSGRNLRVESQVSPSTMAMSKMSLGEGAALAATQAGIHVGVESAFKDKDWAPYVANFTGEALGTIAFATAAKNLGNNEELGKVLDPGDPDDDKIEMGEAFRQQVKSDAVRTAIYVGAMDALGGSFNTKQPYAQVIANEGSRLFDNFTVNKNDYSPLFTGKKGRDKVIEPLVNAGASLGMAELLETHELQNLQKKMHPAVFSHFTAMNVASAQALLGDEENRAGIGAQMAGVHERLVDFGYDPGRSDGRPTDDAGPVYNTTRANSQLWNFSDLGAMTRTAAYDAEQGRNWRQRVTRSASSGPFAPYADRAKQVYDRAAAESLTDIAYGISNKVFENATPIVEKFNPDANPEDIKSLQKDIAGYPGRVRVNEGKTIEVRKDRELPEGWSFNQEINEWVGPSSAVAGGRKPQDFLRFDFPYAPDDPEPGQTGQVQGFLKDTPDLFVPLDSHYPGDDPDAPADLKDRPNLSGKAIGMRQRDLGRIFIPRRRTGGGMVELIPHSKLNK